MIRDTNHNPLPKHAAYCGQSVHFFFGGRRTAEGKYTNKPDAKEALRNKKSSEGMKLGIRLYQRYSAILKLY